MPLVVLSVVRLLAVGPEEGVGNVGIEMQGVLPLAELKEERTCGWSGFCMELPSIPPHQLQHRIIHLGVQRVHVHFQVLRADLFAVQIEGHVILDKDQSHGADRILAQRLGIKVLRVDLLPRVDVDGHLLVLAVQEERELVFGRWEINHEKGLQRNLQLSPGPVHSCLWTVNRGLETRLDLYRYFSSALTECDAGK